MRGIVRTRELAGGEVLLGEAAYGFAEPALFGGELEIHELSLRRFRLDWRRMLVRPMLQQIPRESLSKLSISFTGVMSEKYKTIDSDHAVGAHQ